MSFFGFLTRNFGAEGMGQRAEGTDQRIKGAKEKGKEVEAQRRSRYVA